jgi:hypothetical protein
VLLHQFAHSFVEEVVVRSHDIERTGRKLRNSEALPRHTVVLMETNRTSPTINAASARVCKEAEYCDPYARAASALSPFAVVVSTFTTSSAFLSEAAAANWILPACSI